MNLNINKNKIEVSFRYDEVIIRQIKQIRGATWKPFPFRIWTVPFTQDSITKLQDIGFSTADINQSLTDTQDKKQFQYNTMISTVKQEFPFLFPYQTEAVAKGIVNKRLYLADDLGLGKCIISASIIEHFMRTNEINKAFIICPKPLIQQTIDDIKKHLKIDYIPAVNRLTRQDTYTSEPRVITSYDVASNDIRLIQDIINKQGLILDEATKIKNVERKRTKNLSLMTPKIAVFNSATPYETKLSDVYNVATVLYPDWMSKQEYYSYCVYERHPYIKVDRIIEGRRQKVPLRTLRGYVNLDKFAERFNEIGIKRRYEDVITQAIKEVHYNRQIELNNTQQDAISLIRETMNDDFISSSTLIQMISSHPQLILNTNSQRIQNVLRNDSITDNLEKSSSPKLEYLQDIITNEFTDNKIVIFSKFIEMRKFIKDSIPKDITVYDIDTIKQFKKDTNRSTVILGDSSIYGTDLPEASLLINFDLLWNPAHMKQRNGRIKRVTTKHNIKIVNLISEGLEQYMFDYQQHCQDKGNQAVNINQQLRKFIVGN